MHQLLPADARVATIDDFVARTRAAVFVRAADDLLVLRPDKAMGLNQTATAILSALYARDAGGAAEVLSALAPQLGVEDERLLSDAHQLIETVGAVLREDWSDRPGLRFEAFAPDRIRYPTLAEIALTYACNNRCAFCYASSPYRAKERPAMSTEQIKQCMDVIFNDAQVPSLSFTGGEATLRKDLPELVRYGAEMGLRINIISNGVRFADEALCRTLVDAGLASAQISLEAAEPELHDSIVGRKGAHAATVAGVRNLRALGIHVHTNTTLCAENLHVAEDAVRYCARDLESHTMSCNMVIRTGEAQGSRPMGVSYTEVAERLPSILQTAKDEGIRFVWYSPIPYCIFNPVLHELGAKSCACIDGILSVDPTGQVLPCSSFEAGIGSLLEEPWTSIRERSAARYWTEKRYVPPPCKDCSDADVCGGACPLYWDDASDFSELPRAGATDPDARAQWERERLESGAFGVPPRTEVE